MSDLAHDLDATPAPAQATPTVAPPAPAPATPVPMPIGTMRVGHAEDRAESDADAMADSALSRLRRMSDDTETGSAGQDVHAHGPGCDHLRRSAAPTPLAGPVVGREGGDLDAGTSAAIESARGSGAPLRGDVKRRMETAFATDFSAVRVHDDAKSAQLNTAVSAHAFTTGNDIFFGKGKFAPATTGGERMLAHELAHVVQNSGGTHRTIDPKAGAAIARSVGVSTAVARRWELPWRKKKEAAPAAPEKSQAEKDTEKSRTDGAATLKEFAEKNREAFKQHKLDAAQAKADAPKARQQGGAALHELAVKGRSALVEKKGDEIHPDHAAQAAQHSTAAKLEIAKPAGVGAAVAGTAGGTYASSASAASSAASMVLSPVLMADAAMGLHGARKLRNEGAELGDDAMVELGTRKAKDQAQGFTAAAINTTRAGVGLGHSVGAAAGSAALNVAGGALGVATGSAQVLQGMWRGGKAVMKLCRLAWGRAATMLSERGAAWKKAIQSAEKYKAAIAAAKMALGALGIAAGALLIVSNPIGWGIGLAAAIAGGVYAAVKIAGKIKNAKDRSEAADRIAKGITPDELFKADVGNAIEGPATAKAAVPAPTKTGSGFATPKAGKKATPEAHKKAVEQANALAREASSHARLADELRTALRSGDRVHVQRGIERSNEEPKFDRFTFIARPEDRELHDSFLLLSSINVDPDEALAESGQELIEKKLSKVESM